MPAALGYEPVIPDSVGRTPNMRVDDAVRWSMHFLHRRVLGEVKAVSLYSPRSSIRNCL